MATVSPEMDAMLTHAERNSLCLWQVFDRSKSHFDAEGEFLIKNWEDCLWDPVQLRKAIIDYPKQTRAGSEYHGHNYSEAQLTDFTRWRLINPQDIYLRYQEEISCYQKAAEYYKSIWIDKTIKDWDREATTKFWRGE